MCGKGQFYLHGQVSSIKKAVWEKKKKKERKKGRKETEGSVWYFPGSPVFKNLCCNTEDTGSIPGLGTKIPYAMEIRSPCAATRESTCCNDISSYPATKTLHSQIMNE